MLNDDVKGRAADPAPHKSAGKAEASEREPPAPPAGTARDPEAAPETKPAKVTGSGFGSFEG